MGSDSALRGAESLLVIGAGRMGGAIVSGWVSAGLAAQQIHVIDHSVSAVEALVETLGVNGYTALEQIAPELRFSTVLVALKPQIIADVLPHYTHLIAPKAQLLSIAAGTTVGQFKALLPEGVAVTRIMPNTPLLVSKGVIAAYSCEMSTQAQCAYTQALFSDLGTFHWLSSEQQLHAVTAISGSGPAYLFYFAECFTAAAEKLDLPPALGRELALQTLAGASCLMEQDHRDVSELRREVTSPNGTTAAAIEQLSAQAQLHQLLGRTLGAARDRSIALAQE
ncbi:MAG: pyrroline-5-carboxylate reductase [Pseudomonadales bacterium]